MSIAEKISAAEQYKSILKDARDELSVSIRQLQQDLDEIKTDHRATTVNLSLRQAGKILGVSKKTVSRWLDNGKLQSTTLVDVMNCRWKKNRVSR